MRFTLALLWVCSIGGLGCGGDDDPAVDGGGDTFDAPVVTYDARPDYDAMEPDATPPGAFDCSTVPASPVSTRAVAGARGYHGLAITPDGRMIGSDGSSLIAATSDGQWSVFVPGFGYGEQADWLPDGDLVMAADNGTLARIDEQGIRTTMASEVYAYGVVVGPDDMIYTGSWGEGVKRVDPDSGQVTTLIANVPSTTHSVEFSRDGRRLYIGTVGDGTVYYQDFDEDMNLVGDVAVFADGVGWGWHDAVGVDACGYLYVPDYDSSTLYRVSPGGTVQPYWQPPSFEQYTHGLIWGSGQHGWRDDALYLPQPYNDNTVIEIVIGVPSRDFDGTVINAPGP